MKWLALALALVACGTAQVEPPAARPLPLADPELAGATPACIYVSTIDVQQGTIVVYWSEPPCAGTSMQRWTATIRWHCPVIQVLALTLPQGDKREPVVYGKRCPKPEPVG